MHAPPNSEHGASSSRGGISGNRAKPTIASAVITASVLRHCGKTSLRLRNSSKNTPSVMTKWAVP